MSFAFADTVNFCFDRSVNLEYARKELMSIAAPSDQIDIRRAPHCLEAEVSAERVILFDKYLRRLYPGKVRQGEHFREDPVERAESIASFHCTIEVEQVGKDNSQLDEVSVGNKNRLKRTETQGVSSSKSQMLLGKGRTGKLVVNGRSVTVSCSPRGAQYQIDIQIQAPNGSVETSLTVSQGQRVDLGNIVDQFERNGRLLDINSGAGVTKEQGMNRSDYYLTVR